MYKMLYFFIEKTVVLLPKIVLKQKLFCYPAYDHCDQKLNEKENFSNKIIEKYNFNGKISFFIQLLVTMIIGWIKETFFVI